MAQKRDKTPHFLHSSSFSTRLNCPVSRLSVDCCAVSEPVLTSPPSHRVHWDSYDTSKGVANEYLCQLLIEYEMWIFGMFFSKLSLSLRATTPSFLTRKQSGIASALVRVL